MQSELQTAIRRAGFKLGGGLLLVAALVGVRIVTATPDGVESEIAELEQLEAELARGDAPGSEVAPANEAEEGASIVTRLGAGVRERLPGSRAGSQGGAADAERLVSCDVDGTSQFMRAADCATRGGRSRDLD